MCRNLPRSQFPAGAEIGTLGLPRAEVEAWVGDMRAYLEVRPDDAEAAHNLRLTESLLEEQVGLRLGGRELAGLPRAMLRVL